MQNPGLKSLLDKTGTGYIKFDATGYILDTNQAFGDILEANSVSKIIGQRIFNWLTPTTPNKNIQNIAQSIKVGEHKKLICHFQTFRGNEIIVSVNICLEQQNEERQFFAVCQDITSQIKENQITSKKRFQLDAALDAAKAGVFHYNFEQDIIYWDDRSYAIFNIKPENFLDNYSAWLELVHPDDIVETEQKFQIATESTNEFELDYRIITSKGIRWINVKARIIRDEAGKAIFCQGLHQDMTDANKTAELLQAKAALEKSQTEVLKQTKLLRSIIDSIPDLIFFKDLEGRYLGCNRAFEKFINLEEAILIGKNDYDLFPKSPFKIYSIKF